MKKLLILIFCLFIIKANGQSPKEIEQGYQINVLTSAGNVFYIGLENRIALNKPLDSNLFISSSSSVHLSLQDERSYIANVGFGIEKVTIYINKVSGRDTSHIQEFIFSVKEVPNPDLYYGSNPLVVKEKNYHISKRVFLEAKSFKLKLDMDFSNAENLFSVTSYTVRINGTPYISSSATISESLKTAMSKAQPGSKFKIEDIRYKGPNGITYKGPSIETEIEQ